MKIRNHKFYIQKFINVWLKCCSNAWLNLKLWKWFRMDNSGKMSESNNNNQKSVSKIFHNYIMRKKMTPVCPDYANYRYRFSFSFMRCNAICACVVLTFKHFILVLSVKRNGLTQFRNFFLNSVFECIQLYSYSHVYWGWIVLGNGKTSLVCHVQGDKCSGSG